MTIRKKRSGAFKAGLFVGFILLLGAGLTAAWFFAAGKIEQTVNGARQQLAERGIAADCDGMAVRGFPFRIGLFCRSMHYADPVGGVTVSGKALRSAAQLYRPGHVVAELDGPLEITAPGFVPLSLNWQNLQTSTRVSTGGLRRFSLVTDRLDVSARDFGVPDLLGSLEQLQFHLRAGDEDAGGGAADLEASLRADGWQIDDGGTGLIEPVDLSVSALAENGLAVAMSGQDLLAWVRANGGALKRSDITFSTRSGGRLRLRGPLQVDGRGRLSGEIEVDLDDPSKLVDYAASIFPPARDMLAQPVGYLEQMAADNNGRREIRGLKLLIDKGSVRLGFIEIARLPRLF
ncbi:MAG: DUF2125 domain-containing protein [Nitratireductor sp.]|nr:DUF2125 domain-containing protein [Nitratireductor sp.]